jgi:dolichol-phosphate mannosyltransferase
MEKLKCVLVMPAYNEAGCIEMVVLAWSKALTGLFGVGAFKMIVVNDGSRDETGPILDSVASRMGGVLTVVHQVNAGHGPALVNAYTRACALDAEYIFHVDSDDQFIPGEFGRLWDKRGGSSFIMGWRKNRQDAFHRHVISLILRMMLGAIFQVNIKDSNIPYRLIQRDYLSRLLSVLPSGTFAPNIFLAVLAARDGCDVMNIPVTHEDRKTGVVSMMGWKLFKICIRSFQELVDFRVTLGSRLRKLKS